MLTPQTLEKKKGIEVLLKPIVSFNLCQNLEKGHPGQVSTSCQAVIAVCSDAGEEQGDRGATGGVRGVQGRDRDAERAAAREGGGARRQRTGRPAAHRPGTILEILGFPKIGYRV